MKTTILMIGAMALVATAATPAMAHQTRAQMATAKKCHAMSHKAMMRNRSCVAMQKRMMKGSMMHRDGAMSGDGRMSDGRGMRTDDGMSRNDGSMDHNGSMSSDGTMTPGGSTGGTGPTPRR